MSDIFYMFTKLNQFYQKVDVLLKIMLKSIDVWGRQFIKQKIDNCSFQQLLQHNLRYFYLNTSKTLSLRSFILKPTETAYVLLKNSTRHFWHWHFFYVTITGNFETNFETNFLKSENLFYKIGSDILLQVLYYGVRSWQIIQENQVGFGSDGGITHYSLYPLVLTK